MLNIIIKINSNELNFMAGINSYNKNKPKQNQKVKIKCIYKKCNPK